MERIQIDDKRVLVNGEIMFIQGAEIVSFKEVDWFKRTIEQSTGRRIKNDFDLFPSDISTKEVK